MNFGTQRMIAGQNGPAISPQIQGIASSMRGAGMMYPGGNPDFNESTGVMGSGALGGTVPGAGSPTADWFDANRPGGWAGAMDQNRQSAERMFNTPSPAAAPGTSMGPAGTGVSTPTIGGPQWLSQMLAGLGRPVGSAPSLPGHASSSVPQPSMLTKQERKGGASPFWQPGDPLGDARFGGRFGNPAAAANKQAYNSQFQTAWNAAPDEAAKYNLLNASTQAKRSMEGQLGVTPDWINYMDYNRGGANYNPIVAAAMRMPGSTGSDFASRSTPLRLPR